MIDRVATFDAFDEISEGENGKRNYIGAYQQEIVFRQFPASLDQIYFVIKLLCDLNDRPKTLGFRIEISGRAPEVFEERRLPDTGAPAPGAQRIQLNQEVCVNDIHFDGPGEIKTYAIADGVELYGGRILVVARPDHFPPAPVWGDLATSALMLLRARGGVELDMPDSVLARLVRDVYRTGRIAANMDTPLIGHESLAVVLTPHLDRFVIYTKSAERARSWAPAIENIPEDIKISIQRDDDYSFSIIFSRSLTIQELQDITIK